MCELGQPWPCESCPLDDPAYQAAIEDIDPRVWKTFEVANRLEAGRRIYGMTPALWEVVDFVQSIKHKCEEVFRKQKEGRRTFSPQRAHASAIAQAEARAAAIHAQHAKK